MQKQHWIFGILVLVASAVLPVIGHWARERRADRCDFDGMSIHPVFRVRIVHVKGAAQFCCFQCAELWLARQPSPPTAITVTDEVTSRELDVSLATFVESSVVTMPHTRNRIHAFQSQSDAETHARLFQGHVLQQFERPLQLQNLAQEGGKITGGRQP